MKHKRAVDLEMNHRGRYRAGLVPRVNTRVSIGCPPSILVLMCVFLIQGLAGEETHTPGTTLFKKILPSTSGIGWVHENAMSEERYLPETLGPGCAFFDYDNDGWVDVYLVQYGPSDFYTPEKPLSNALYRNNGDGTFSNVTKQAGVSGGHFGMGVAAADYDNDGDTDLHITAYGRSILYGNQGNGTFRDITLKSGLEASGWTTSSVWFDYDNDGKLDLFLCSFVRYSLDDLVLCGNNLLGRNYYCIPTKFEPTPSLLFRNNGDGTFTEVGYKSDIGRSMGKALGVVATDINNDRLMDLFVANDTVQNFLFINRGNDQWEEVGFSSEVGFSLNGKARSGMGVDAADFNDDGWQDLFVANVDQEMFALYQNEGDESFRDLSHPNQVAQATRLLSGWGLKFLDFDVDGDVDLFLANGHPDDMVDSYALQVTYEMPLLLFENVNGRLFDISQQAGAVFAEWFPARGLSVGDYDNDGRVDILVANNGREPILLKNMWGPENHWIGLKLVGKTCNRDGIGALIRWSVDGVVKGRLKTSGGSYLASHDQREVLGLGKVPKLDWIEIHWPAPSSRVQRFTDLPVDAYLTLTEGEVE